QLHADRTKRMFAVRLSNALKVETRDVVLEKDPVTQEEIVRFKVKVTTKTGNPGGYVLNGHKFFVSLAGAAHYYSPPALLIGDGPWLERTLYLQVPKDAPGVTFQGEWDPLGMRGTVSRDMVLQEVFVPDAAEILPPGLF